MGNITPESADFKSKKDFFLSVCDCSSLNSRIRRQRDSQTLPDSRRNFLSQRQSGSALFQVQVIRIRDTSLLNQNGAAAIQIQHCTSYRYNGKWAYINSMFFVFGKKYILKRMIFQSNIDFSVQKIGFMTGKVIYYGKEYHFQQTVCIKSGTILNVKNILK